MANKREEGMLEEYLTTKNLKHSRQREIILNTFLGQDKHLTADELYRLVKKKSPAIGFATVYRTLKLICECGLGRQLVFEDGITRYEHLYGHQHHDHLVCIKCGRFVEVVDPGIEELQERLFKLHGFHPRRHRLELYGICRKCKYKNGKRNQSRV